MKNIPLRASVLIMGLSSITAQIVLLRELLVSFYGNELILGIILANWLLLEALGSFGIGRSAEKTERILETYVLLMLIFSITFPSALYLSRVFKNVLIAAPGETVGFVPVFYSSLLVLLPVALPHGALFAYGSHLYSRYLKEEASPIGNVYLLETVGITIGGLLLSYLLLRHLNSFEIALALSLLNALTSILLLRPEAGSRESLRRRLRGLSILMTLGYAVILFSPVNQKIHWSSVQTQWRSIGAIHYENSVYGNITVTQKGEQYTFYANGMPVITTPVPDISTLEDFVHFPMLLHPNPRSVLILSGGVGGMIHEILKHPVSRIDYVELDPLLLKLIEIFSTPLTRSELSDPRLQIHHTDGRFFVNNTAGRFDLIFVGLPAPQELQTNRFFSAEFFRIANQRMNPGGILVLTLPGSLTYLSRESKDLNGCILDTLKGTFPFVKIIPGETNLYLASNSDTLTHATAEDLGQRLEARRIETRLITQSYLHDRLHERWQTWFSRSMEGRAPRINSDFHPLAVFFSLSHWNALFSPSLEKPLQAAEKFTLKQTLAVLLISSFVIALLFVKNPDASIQSVPYAIFTTGLAGMMFNLATIFTFQVLYGYLYLRIGLLVAIFMMGIAAGSLFMIRSFKKTGKGSLLFLGTELGIVLFAVLLPFLFLGLGDTLREGSTAARFEAVFWAASFLSGMLTGLQFPLATEIYLHDRSRMKSPGRAAGMIYGADLLGGFFGGLLGGVFLLPILGLKDTCLLIALIKMSSLLLFFVFTRVKKAGPGSPPMSVS